jgi:hypothetical protein
MKFAADLDLLLLVILAAAVAGEDADVGAAGTARTVGRDRLPTMRAG